MFSPVVPTEARQGRPVTKLTLHRIPGHHGTLVSRTDAPRLLKASELHCGFAPSPPPPPPPPPPPFFIYFFFLSLCCLGQVGSAKSRSKPEALAPQISVGLLVRDLAEKFLLEHGTALRQPLLLRRSERLILFFKLK